MDIGQPGMDSDAAFQAILEQIRESIAIAIRDVMTGKPDSMIMEMSSETLRSSYEIPPLVSGMRRRKESKVTRDQQACRPGQGGSP